MDLEVYVVNCCTGLELRSAVKPTEVDGVPTSPVTGAITSADAAAMDTIRKGARAYRKLPLRFLIPSIKPATTDLLAVPVTKQT
jgi:hypothetical protein